MDNKKKIVLLGSSAVILALLELKSRKKSTRRCWVREIYLRRKQQGFFDNLTRELRINSPELFFNFTRMSATSFEKLLSLCGPFLVKRSPREAIQPSARLMVTLRFLAIGDSYPSLAYGFRIAPSTICHIIFETCFVIWQVLSPKLLQLPNKAQWLQISRDFNKLWQLPNCLGSIDGKHIQIQAPSHSGSLFFNYKKYYSIILLAVCDAQYFFTYVDIGAYGAQSDGGVLKNSQFGQLLQNGLLNIPDGQELPDINEKVPLYFIGDEAFPLQINLLRPYSKKRGEIMPEDESIFNYRLSRVRRTIENTFGIMVARFRIYHKVINADPDTVDLIIKATTCLHNFIKQQKGDAHLYCSELFVDHETNGIFVPGQWRREVPNNSVMGQRNLRFGTRNHTREAFNFREYMKNYLTGIGSVSWQLVYIRKTN